MRSSKAFTLIEVLIALTISIFIILGMTQLYRNAVSFIVGSREVMSLNKKVSLLFNQLENDISTAFIPFLYKEKKEEEKKAPQEQVKKEKEKDQKYFLGEIYEDEYRRIEGKKWDLFKSLNFISTNPLEVYGENRPKIIRIKYVLKKNKNKSIADKISYDLFRSETYELQNVDFKEPEEIRTKEKRYAIRTYLIADNIKDFFVEYITLKPKKDQQKTTLKSEEEYEEIKSFVWNLETLKKIFPKKEETQVSTKTAEKKEEKSKEEKYVVPQRLEITIIFWYADMQRQSAFSTLIPIFSYPTREFEEKKDDIKTDQDKVQEGKNEQQTPKPPSPNVRDRGPAKVITPPVLPPGVTQRG